ncbi:MAG TPA: GDSL-type esterase/lipase family protein [Planctomycetota bacterium]|jgi:beta-glucosidase|nr:GDSL family lipase [Planctomycetota bacterium]MDP6128740.1 GDSL-type esterase/lipase family protein [Planctomycetota bacterium]MDP7246569.1 GDSL-type esterase/lipase family protein [Planctomycetota bacterium]HJM38838.1 GDSL-type esterase/lipase family protein [Planctomycetota bacterium]|tara:strand:+ start:7212 stop:7913 length:702 start_codon:yes stop_codon:yes gene_type:complete
MKRFATLLAATSLLAACNVPQPQVEVLEHDAIVPVSRPDAWWQDRHNAQMKLATDAHWDIVFIGDSITQGWEGDGKSVWNANYGSMRALNLGISGDRTQHVLWRIQQGILDNQTPNLVVLNIGTNNSGENTSGEIAEGVKAIVKELKHRLPFTNFLILGIFPRGEYPNDRNRQINIGANRLISRMAFDDRVHYLDIGDVFLEEGGRLDSSIMPDLLHLSPEGYRRWAEAISGS